MTKIHPRLGIVFDIDGLADSLYGFAAYRLLFKSIFAANQNLLVNSRLWDGDTAATLQGSARDYVIAIESMESAALGEIHRAISQATGPALKPLSERFLIGDELAREPLALAARINALGAMDWCETSFVRNAWDAERKAAQTPSVSLTDDGDKQRTPS